MADILTKLCLAGAAALLAAWAVLANLRRIASAEVRWNCFQLQTTLMGSEDYHFLYLPRLVRSVV